MTARGSQPQDVVNTVDTRVAELEEELRRLRTGVSHDLRDPLNAILGFAQVLDHDTRAPLTDRQRDWVRNIVTAARELMKRLDAVVDLPLPSVTRSREH